MLRDGKASETKKLPTLLELSGRTDFKAELEGDSVSILADGAAPPAASALALLRLPSIVEAIAVAKADSVPGCGTKPLVSPTEPLEFSGRVEFMEKSNDDSLALWRLSSSIT